MEVFINYLLESSVILGTLTIFYRLVLHHEPLFKFNRIYLLFSLLLATVVPLIHISVYKSNTANAQGFVNLLDTVNVFAGDVRQTVVPAIADNQSFSWIYILGAIGLLLRLLIGIVRLGGLSKKASWQKINGVKIADLPGRFNPFSFFHVIFINRSLYSDNDLDKIMVHEMAHVKHKHSIDVLLFESLLIVQWFNPFAWLIKYLLKELHEFQADRSVLNKGTSVGSYKNLLLYQATGARLLPVNNFNQSITKKRFKMMTNKTIKNKAFVKTLAAVAVIFGVSLFFACDNLSEEEIQNVELKGAEIDKVYDVVDVMPVYPNGSLEMRKFIAKNVKYPKDAIEQGKAGKVFIQFVVAKDGKVKDVEVARSGGFESLDAEAIRVISSFPDWEPGMKNGAKVDVSFTVPINFSLRDPSESSLKKENYVVEQMPKFPGGDLELRKFIAKNVKYPKDAEKQGVAGKAYVDFVVSKEGIVKDIKIKESAGFESLDTEAIRVISALPKWIPGMDKGENVDVSYTIPIVFALKDSDKIRKVEKKKTSENDNEIHVVGYGK